MGKREHTGCFLFFSLLKILSMCKHANRQTSSTNHSFFRLLACSPLVILPAVDQATSSEKQAENCSTTQGGLPHITNLEKARDSIPESLVGAIHSSNSPAYRSPNSHTCHHPRQAIIPRHLLRPKSLSLPSPHSLFFWSAAAHALGSNTHNYSPATLTLFSPAHWLWLPTKTPTLSPLHVSSQ